MSLPLLLLPLPRTMEGMVAFVHTVTAATSTSTHQHPTLEGTTSMSSSSRWPRRVKKGKEERGDVLGFRCGKYQTTPKLILDFLLTRKLSPLR